MQPSATSGVIPAKAEDTALNKTLRGIPFHASLGFQAFQHVRICLSYAPSWERRCDVSARLTASMPFRRCNPGC